MTDNRWAVYSTEKGGDKVAKKTAKKPCQEVRDEDADVRQEDAHEKG